MIRRIGGLRVKIDIRVVDDEIPEWKKKEMGRARSKSERENPTLYLSLKMNCIRPRA